jgi:hypothetical protein
MTWGGRVFVSCDHDDDELSSTQRGRGFSRSHRAPLTTTLPSSARCCRCLIIITWQNFALYLVEDEGSIKDPFSLCAPHCPQHRRFIFHPSVLLRDMSTPDRSRPRDTWRREAFSRTGSLSCVCRVLTFFPPLLLDIHDYMYTQVRDILGPLGLSLSRLNQARMSHRRHWVMQWAMLGLMQSDTSPQDLCSADYLILCTPTAETEMMRRSQSQSHSCT